MPGKSPLLLTASIFMLFCACMRPKDADIVGAAIIAELAQTQNARPADISVENVSFQTKWRANAEATYRLPEGRLPHSVTFVCEATKAADRWTVKCNEQVSR